MSKSGDEKVARQEEILLDLLAGRTDYSRDNRLLAPMSRANLVTLDHYANHRIKTATLTEGGRVAAEQVYLRKMKTAAQKAAECWNELYPSRSHSHAHACPLCGNSGIVDTRTTAYTASGVPVGSLLWCVCPNGAASRTLKRPTEDQLSKTRTLRITLRDRVVAFAISLDTHERTEAAELLGEMGD